MKLASRWRDLRDARFTPAAIALLTGLPALGNGLVLDDVVLRESTDLRTLPGLARLVTRPTARPDLEPGAGPIYRPLSAAADWLSWQLVRAHAPSQHAIEIALHAIVVTLLARVLVDHGVRKGIAATAAILVAAHPVAALAVASVGSRALLVGFAVLLYALHRAPGIAPAPRHEHASWFGLGFVTTLACVLFHEVFVFAPLAVAARAGKSFKASSASLGGGAAAIGVVAILPAWKATLPAISHLLAAAADVASSSALAIAFPVEPSSFVDAPLVNGGFAAAIVGIAVVASIAPALAIRRMSPGTMPLAACGGAMTIGAVLALAPAVARAGFLSHATGYVLLGGVAVALAPCANAVASRASMRARAYVSAAALGVALASIPLGWSSIATWRSELTLLHATASARSPDTDAEARLARALIASDDGDVATSTPQCIAYAASHPRSTRAHACASRGLVAEGRHEDAVGYARAYAAERSHLERARRTLLAALFAAGRIDEARTLVDDRMLDEGSRRR